MFFLYFITSDDDFMVIGVTTNVERRLYDLQVGNPHLLTCQAVVQFPSKTEALAAEREVTNELAGSHERGTWYKATRLATRLMRTAVPYEEPPGIISRGRQSQLEGDSDRHPRSSVRWSEVPWPEWMDDVDRKNMIRLHRSPGAVRRAVRRLGRRYRNRQ